MNSPLIWLHEEALRLTHPVFAAAPGNTKAIFVWDDGYFRTANYSLKRLVFIYETLCELPLDIIIGDTKSILEQIAPSVLYIPATNNPLLVSKIHTFKSMARVELIEDDPFVILKKQADFHRFFQYWKKAEKTAFLKDSGVHA